MRYEGDVMDVRDIAHEQVSASTTEELLNRKAELQSRIDRWGGLVLAQLAEFHKINSELYCRQNGIKSQPWVTHAA
jgi:hypothetical protein